MLYRYSQDVNIKGAFLLIFNDTLGSIGVIVSSVIIHFTRLYVVDPLTGMAIGCLAAYPTYFLLRDSVHILMEGNPGTIDADQVQAFLHRTFPAVLNVKDVHIWGLTPAKIILMARVRTDGTINHHRDMMKAMKRELKGTFGFFDVFIEGYEAGTADVVREDRIPALDASTPFPALSRTIETPHDRRRIM